MRRRAWLHAATALPASALAPALAHQHAPPEPARLGTHGMALFGGREGLYASHLPMFHAPHDVQLLLRLQLADPRHDAGLREALAERPRLWTLEPERFDLSRLQPGSTQPLRAFKARLVEGHFERGGRQHLAQTECRVEAVLLFQRLLPQTRTQPLQRFCCWGAGREQFLIKHLDQRPDIDLIGRFVNAVPLSGARRLSLPSPGLRAPEPARLLQALRQAGARPLAPPQWLYTESGDLA